MAQAGEFHSKSIQATFASVVGLMLSPSTLMPITLGLFVLPVTAEFGIGRGTYFLIMAVVAVVTAVAASVGGRLMDRYGVRRIVIPGLVAFALVQAAIAQAASVTMLVLACFAMGLTCGAQNPVAYAKVLAQWFSRRRGLVLAVTTALGAGGGALAAPLIKHFIDTGGWRVGYLALGAYIAVLGLPVLLLFLKESPRPGGAGGAAAEATADLPGLTRAEAFRSPAYVKVMGALFLAVGSLVVLSSNGPALLQSRGLDIGAAFLSFMAIGTMIGQVTSGLLLDRINSPRVAIPFTAFALIGGVIVLHFGFSTPVVLGAAFILGLGQGAEVGLAAYLVSRYCGLKHYGALYAIVYGATVAAGGVAPVAAGVVFDVVGNYGPVIIGIDIALALSLLLIILLPPYRFAVVHHVVSPAGEALAAGDPAP